MACSAAVFNLKLKLPVIEQAGWLGYWRRLEIIVQYLQESDQITHELSFSLKCPLPGMITRARHRSLYLVARSLANRNFGERLATGLPREFGPTADPQRRFFAIGNLESCRPRTRRRSTDQIPGFAPILEEIWL